MLESIIDFYNKLMKYVNYLSSFIIGGLLFSIFAVVTAEIITRNFFRMSLGWVIEYSRFALVWIALIGGSCLYYEESHIGVDFLHKYLPIKALISLKLMFDSLTIYFLYIVAKHGYIFAERGIGRLSATRWIEIYYPRLGITIGASLMILQIIRNILNRLTDLQKSSEELEKERLESDKLAIMKDDIYEDDDIEF